MTSSKNIHLYDGKIKNFLISGIRDVIIGYLFSDACAHACESSAIPLLAASLSVTDGRP